MPIAPAFRCLPLLLAGIFAAAPLASAADLFEALPGSWSGGGSVVKTDGTTEALRCKAKYSLTPSGKVMHQELLCAADSYRMDFVTDLVNDGGKLAGTWKERDRQAGGSVSGRIEGDTIETAVTGTAFEATVKITTRGPRQTIALSSPSGTYAKAVNIALKAD